MTNLGKRSFSAIRTLQLSSSVTVFLLLISCTTTEEVPSPAVLPIENLISVDAYVAPTTPFTLYHFFANTCEDCVVSIKNLDSQALGAANAQLSYRVVSLDPSKERGALFFDTRIKDQVEYVDNAVWDPSKTLLTTNTEFAAVPYTMLIDRTGVIIWSKSGTVDEEDAVELKALIKKNIESYNFKTITPSRRPRFSATDPEVTGEPEPKKRVKKKKKIKKQSE